MVFKLHALVSLHPLFPRQTLVFRQLNARAGPRQRFDSKARACTDCCADVMRKLRIDQYHSRCAHIDISRSVSAAERRSAGRARAPVPTSSLQNSGQGTSGHGSAFAHGESNPTARRRFRQRSIRGQTPLTWSLIAGGTIGCGVCPFQGEVSAAFATQLVFCFFAEERAEVSR